MGALQEEGLRFQLIGMSAAIVQGVEGTTKGVDLWIDLPSRQNMRAINVSRRVGAEMIRNTVVELEAGTLVNFVYEVTGLRRFAIQYAKARGMEFQGLEIPVLPLSAIRRSKSAIGRPKDLLHLELIKQALRGSRRVARSRRAGVKQPEIHRP